MRYVAKVTLTAAVVVAATVGGGAAVWQAVADDAPKPQQTAGQPQPGRPAQMWGEEKAGLACSISTKKATFQPGEPISVRFDLKNVSEKPITVEHCGFWPNHRWVVRDAAGRDLKLTDRGRLCRERYDDPEREKSFPVVVQPGKLDASYYGPYDLRRLFKIPESATVHVQCVYAHSAGGRKIEIISNTLALKVERPLTAENDGVKFEVIVTNRSGELSDTKEGDRTKLDLALRITNQTGRALRFGRCRTTGVTMQSTSDEPYGIKTRRELGHSGDRKPALADFPLLEPGQCLTLKAYWRDSVLQLGDADDYFAGSWSYRTAEPGKYALTFHYIGMVRDVEVLGDDGATVKIPKEEMWHGSVQAPAIKVTLAGPPPGVQCEAIVPDRSWEIPDKDEGKRTKVDMAVRITNRTGRAFYFSRHDTIRPMLKSTSGKTYDYEGGRNRSRLPRPADCPLLKSGESVTFAIDAHLYWQDDELMLGGGGGFGGIWFFRGLEPGEYALTLRHARYKLDHDVSLRDGRTTVKIPKDQVWQGEVQTAPVKITLIAGESETPAD